MNFKRRPLQETLRSAIESDPAVAAMNLTPVASGEVRLLCPRGHFIANLAVIDFGGARVLLRPRGKDQQHFGDTFNDPNHGFRFDGQVTDKLRNRVRLKCIREKCSYDGSFDYETLGLEMRKVVTAGHAEYRLTN